MAASAIQSAFSAGEISPELYGEVSLAKYSSSLTTCRNAVVNFRGGALSRGGLAFVGRCKQSVSGTGPPRPVPFQFSNNQGYVLEFGDQYLRFVFQGGYVLETSISITGATQANPCQISAVNTFANGDWVFIAGVGGMTQLNGETYIVAGASGTHFTLQDLNGVAINSTGFGAYTSGGQVARIYTITTPYSAVDLPYLKFSQSADVMSLSCSNPVTGTEYPPYDLTRLSAIDWTLVQTSFAPAITAPTGAWALANTQAPTNGTNATFAYVVTAVDSKGNESSPSNIASCHGADIQVEAGGNVVTWYPVQGAAYYNVYRAPASVDTGTGGSAHANPVPAGSIYGFVGSSYAASFLDSNTTPDLTQTPPNYGNPFARGQILGVPITSPGSGLSAVSYSITTSTGSGFAANPLVTNAYLGGMQIVAAGQNYQPGDSIAFNGAGFATGAIDSGGTNAVDGQTVTLNGVVFTFKTTVTAGNQVLIGGSLSATLANLVAALQASTNIALTVASYSVDVTGANLVVTYNTAGPSGNSYTLAAGAPWTVSGATLTGGSGAGGGTAPTGTLQVGPTSGTYPGVNAYFQQRHFFACSLNNPDTVWASQTGRYANFGTSIPTIATDAITASPWTTQVNGIQWLVPMPGGLIAMTGLQAWQIVGEGSYQLNSAPITPSTTQAQPQAFNGCSPTVPPIVIDDDLLYVQALEGSVYDLSWNFWVNIYTGNDLTILSSHLFLNKKLVQWCFAREPYKLVWAVRNDGTMLSLTYLKEQNVYGWARHDTQGLIVGVCSIEEPPVKAVYAVVQRFTPYAPSGIYVMERMDNRLWRTVEDTYAVDCAVSNPMTNPTCALMASANAGSGVTFTALGATPFTAASVGQIIRMGGGIVQVTGYTDSAHVTGTWVLGGNNGAPGFPFSPAGNWSIASPVTTLNAPHLAGMTVYGLADGVPIGPLTVGAAPLGVITLPFAASNVKVGLPFTVQMQTPYLNGPDVVQGARKAIPAATIRLAASASFTFGTNQPDGAAQNPPQLAPTWSNMAAANILSPTGGQTSPQTYTTPGGQTATQLWTGDLRVVGQGNGWNSKGQVAIQQTLPLPLEVVSVEPEILPGDTPEVAIKPDQQQGQSGQPRRGPGTWMIKGARL